jgi:predicted molibdopterin-dependent oxidoreductase YjgC
MTTQLELTVDDKTVRVASGSSVLSAAREVGVDIPTLCYLDGAPHFTACMICLVEDRTSGTLLPACSTPVEEGMAIVTGGERVETSRRVALELLLSEHVGDCEAPCRRVCPSGLDIPRVLRHVASGALDVAARLVWAVHPDCCMGKDCNARCERICRRGQVDAPVAIRAVIRHVSEHGRANDVAEPSEPAQRNVSVLGKLGDDEKRLMMQGVSPQVRHAEAAVASGESARSEAARCMHCDCRKAEGCRLRELADRYGAEQRRLKGEQRRAFRRVDDHPEVVFEEGKCVKCGICVRIARAEGADPGLTFIGRGIEAQVGVPFGDALRDGLGDLALRLAEACPTGAIARRDQSLTP